MFDESSLLITHQPLNPSTPQQLNSSTAQPYSDPLPLKIIDLIFRLIIALTNYYLIISCIISNRSFDYSESESKILISTLLIAILGPSKITPLALFRGPNFGPLFLTFLGLFSLFGSIDNLQSTVFKGKIIVFIAGSIGALVIFFNGAALVIIAVLAIGKWCCVAKSVKKGEGLNPSFFNKIMNTNRYAQSQTYKNASTPQHLNSSTPQRLNTSTPQHFMIPMEMEMTRQSLYCCCCRKEVGLKGVVVELPGCGGRVHSDCLAKWLRKCKRCPECKEDLEEFFRLNEPF